MAERGGFEPPEPIEVHLFSRQASSTTPAPLRVMFYFILLKMNAPHDEGYFQTLFTKLQPTISTTRKHKIFHASF